MALLLGLSQAGFQQGLDLFLTRPQAVLQAGNTQNARTFTFQLLSTNYAQY